MNTEFSSVKIVKYPLYPSMYSFKRLFRCWGETHSHDKATLIQKLKMKIASIFKLTDEDSIYLFDSGSSALLASLKLFMKTSDLKKAYIPSYSCTEIADTIISAGLIFDVYDISDDFRPVDKFLDILPTFDSSSLLVLPALFGSHILERKIGDKLNTSNMSVIFDEAQSFPMQPQFTGTSTKHYISIISFGKSKPLSAIGGGAMVLHNSYLRNIANMTISQCSISKPPNLIQNIITLVFRNMSRILWVKKISGEYKHRYPSLEVLHHHSEISIKKDSSITEEQTRMALFSLKDFSARKNRQYNSIEQLKKTIILAFGVESIRFVRIREWGSQCLFLLWIPNDKRKNIADRLAKYGMETTFYYYPLHKIERYANLFQLERCYISERLSFETLLLPINIDVSQEQIDKIKKIIEREFI